MDSRSGKNTDTAGHRGSDAGASYRGGHAGIAHATHVTTADVTDLAGTLAMSYENQPDLNHVRKVPVDAGYTGKPIANAVQCLLEAVVEVVKRNGPHTFMAPPKRWEV